MPIFARIEDSIVREIREFDSIEGRFHPSLIWVEAPEEVCQGWLYEDGQFSPPPPEPEPEPQPDPSGFLDAAIDYIGPQEANALLAKYPLLYPAIVQPRTGATALGIIDAMLGQGDITQEQYDEIMNLWDEYHMPRQGVG